MIISESDIRQYLDIAKKSVLLAGDFLLNHGRTNINILNESEHDIKISADIDSEKIIIDYLSAESDFSILSEEKGLLVRGNQEFSWIVDPLDGSLNYSKQIPLSCVSIGLWAGKKPVLGVVYDFNRDELFSGAVGQGAWLGNNLLKVSRTERKEKAVLCTGFPVNTDFSSENIRRFVKDIGSYRKVRLLGSAALSLVYVASARGDVYCEENIMLWDVAGGIPILLGAGGKLNISEGLGDYSFNVSAWNGLFDL